MSDHPAIGAVIGLPPGDTVRAFEARDALRSTIRWSEMWHEDHARAFTVAKVARLDMLAEMQASIADVLANGGTFEQWRNGIVPYLRKQGWWGEVQDRSLTGTDDVVHVGSRRLRTIYDTNLRVSRAAGQWTRIQELKAVRPFLRYTAVLDSRTRPEHRRWHGVILPVDHPWWDTHYPPCGWFCRCTVRQLSQRDLDRKGWKVSDVPDDGPLVPFLRADGQTVEVPRGISPGFAYNPGKASLAAAADVATRSIERHLSITAAVAERGRAVELATARATVEALVDSDDFLTFLGEPQGAFPIGVLDDQALALLNAPSRVVVLPMKIKAKQDDHHGDIALAEYRNLPRLIHDPLVIVDLGDTKLVYFAPRSDDPTRLYRAVLRTDAGRANTAVVSFHKVGDRDIASTAAKGRIVLDRRSVR